KMPKTGALISTGGLAPSSMGAKVRVSGGKVVVTDGPFTETKEIVGGFAIVDVASKEEAIAIAREFWQLHADVLGPSYAGGGEMAKCFTRRNVAHSTNRRGDESNGLAVRAAEADGGARGSLMRSRTFRGSRSRVPGSAASDCRHRDTHGQSPAPRRNHRPG